MDSSTFLIKRVKYFEILQQKEHDTYQKLLFSSLTPEGEISQEKSVLLQYAAEMLRRNEAGRAAEIERASNESIQRIAAQRQHEHLATIRILEPEPIQEMQNRTLLPLLTYSGAERIIHNQLVLPSLRKRKIPDQEHANQNDGFVPATLSKKLRMTDAKTEGPVFEFEEGEPILELLDTTEVEML
ncbi:unnamed protein product [Ceutorhynchus assimilis]|uniref:Uncharacterized protein n=1 Tax=Ceutorhynchus assimilis TaxID=467358 RepID=A0A9N9MLK7_9CUCU|nr:unnamed protein product [Ceutorhynchus assimilis]